MKCSDFLTLLNTGGTRALTAEACQHRETCASCRSQCLLDARLDSGFNVLAKTPRPPDFQPRLLKVFREESASGSIWEPWFGRLAKALGVHPFVPAFSAITLFILLLSVAVLHFSTPRLPIKVVSPSDWTFTANQGTVTIADRAIDMHKPVLLEFGKTLILGPSSTGVLTRKDFATLQLESASLTIDSEGKALILDQGKALITCQRQEHTWGLLIKTPFGEVRDVGTVFSLDVASSELRLEVKEGLVRVLSNSQQTDYGPGSKCRYNLHGFVHGEASPPGTPDLKPLDRKPTSDD